MKTNNIIYPSAISCIDVAIFSQDRSKILLGRKPKSTHWVFIGGFVDNELDLTFENAVVRETSEEAIGVFPVSMRYIGSSIINDNRYSNSIHKIFTSFFECLAHTNKEQVKAGDDLEEVKWWDKSYLSSQYTIILDPKHHVLWNILICNSNFYRQS